ncbi:MAG: M36 family metallopeptidase [Candidatus Eisenbacteria bacterium]|nr:M36 family metallopeptidase [Candidatus Eisenbacteria bacterium]
MPRSQPLLRPPGRFCHPLRVRPLPLLAALTAALFAILPPAAANAAVAQRGATPDSIRRDEASVAIPAGRLDARTNAVRSLFGVGFRPRPAAPEQMAREYLAHAAAELGMSADLTDLEFMGAKDGLGTHHARFRQTWRGIPVYAAQVVVSLRDDGGEVTAVTSGYRPAVAPASATPALAAAAAERIALAGLGAHETPAVGPLTGLVVWPGDGADRLAWRVLAVLADPPGDWEVLVDALSGEVISTRDRMCYVHGSGMVFNPDPLTMNSAPYGTPGLVDGGDADTPQLTASRVQMPLFDILEVPGAPTYYQMSGLWTVIQDFPGALGLPAGDNVVATQQTDPDAFNYTRSQQGFEAVSAYAHITILHEWIRLLGFANIVNRVVPADPHGWGGADQSSYSPLADAFAFGEGGVDDAEDAGVIVHEYGHAIQADQVPDWGVFLEGAAMGEGFGDYLAGSYCAWLGAWQQNWAMKWDATWTAGAPGLRRLDSPRQYPDSLKWEEHADGQIWSACLWQIHAALGRWKTDRIVLQSHFYLTPGATFRDGALALLQADSDIYGGVDVAAIQAVFVARGILSPIPFAVGVAPENQRRPAVSYDRTVTSDRFWGRTLMTLWNDGRNAVPEEVYGRRVHPSGQLFPGEQVLVMADPDLAFAPAQPVPPLAEPDFLAVGTRMLGTETDIYGEFVRDSSFIPTGGFAIAQSLVNEHSPAVDAVDSTYLAVWVVDDGTGSAYLGYRRIGQDSTFVGAPGVLAFPDYMQDPAVGAGRDPLTGDGQFLVAWSQGVNLPSGHAHIRAARIAEDGTVLDPAGIDVALGVPGPPGVFHMTPAVAFDGTHYLVVWHREDLGAGQQDTRGCFVDAATGATFGPLLIDAGPNTRYPDVAFASSQYLAVWETHPLPPNQQDIRGVRLDVSGTVLDSPPLALAATALRERYPAVTQTGGDDATSAGGGFYVAWSQSPVGSPSDYDVWGTLVPELLTPVPPPLPLALGVGVIAPPDTSGAPSDTLLFNFMVVNSGSRKDAYRLVAVGTRPWSLAWSTNLVALDAVQTGLVLVRVVISPAAAVGDTDVVTLFATSTSDSTVTALGQLRVAVESPPNAVDPGPGVAFLSLAPGVPNPFSASTRLRFTLPRDGEAGLDVFDLSGHRVRTLASGRRAAGAHAAVWDGADERGHPVASGIYFVRLAAERRVLTRRLTLIR